MTESSDAHTNDGVMAIKEVQDYMSLPRFTDINVIMQSQTKAIIAIRSEYGGPPSMCTKLFKDQNWADGNAVELKFITGIIGGKHD